MSVYTQEVLGLLKRNKKKIKLDKIRDHFEFGKLYRNSTLIATFDLKYRKSTSFTRLGLKYRNM